MDRFEEIIDATFPVVVPTEENTNSLQVQRSAVARGKITDMFLNRVFFESTAWSLINAVSNFEQWHAPIRKYGREIIACVL